MEDSSSHKVAVKSFEHKTKEMLDKEINDFIQDKPNASISVWTDASGHWCGSVQYRYANSNNDINKPIMDKNGYIDLINCL